MDRIITASLLGHYYICQRKAWLYSRQISPDSEHTNLEIGRYLQEKAYSREIVIDNLKYDVIGNEDGVLIIGEIKKSMAVKKSSLLQLGYYLLNLEECGVKAVGELRFPLQKRRETVELTPDLRNELLININGLKETISMDVCPPVKKCAFCNGCAYVEFCWA